MPIPSPQPRELQFIPWNPADPQSSKTSPTYSSSRDSTPPLPDEQLDHWLGGNQIIHHGAQAPAMPSPLSPAPSRRSHTPDPYAHLAAPVPFPPGMPRLSSRTTPLRPITVKPRPTSAGPSRIAPRGLSPLRDMGTLPTSGPFSADPFRSLRDDVPLELTPEVLAPKLHTMLEHPAPYVPQRVHTMNRDGQPSEHGVENRQDIIFGQKVALVDLANNTLYNLPNPQEKVLQDPEVNRIRIQVQVSIYAWHF